MSEMKEISKSTSNLMTGGIAMPKLSGLKKGKKSKTESKTSLIRASAESLAPISVCLFCRVFHRLWCFFIDSGGS